MSFPHFSVREKLANNYPSPLKVSITTKMGQHASRVSSQPENMGLTLSQNLDKVAAIGKYLEAPSCIALSCYKGHMTGSQHKSDPIYLT